MRWHVEGRTRDGVMRHPAYNITLRKFDEAHTDFARDPRNVRLGLASDGFSPFKSMSISHSTWPVILIPYNLPTWLCMKQPYMILSTIIDGPRAPGNDIDVYLQPLVDELQELWVGVATYDASNNHMFQMCVTLLWIFSDFPAFLLYLKNYVRNRRYPEGAIVEGRWIDELMTFCSWYLDDVETKSNPPLRNDVLSNETIDQEGRRSSREKGFKLDDITCAQAHKYVLFNSTSTTSYRDEHIKEIKKENPRLSRHNVDRIHNERFQLWFRNHVEKMHMTGENISEDIQTLAIDPLIQAKRMIGYICDGVRYLTESRDVKRKPQNSGIMLKAITQSYASTKDKNPTLAEEWRMVVKLKPRGFYDLGDDTPIIEHKEGYMELWPEQQLDDTTFETEEDIEWVREGLLRNFVEMARKRQRNSSQGELLYDSSEQQKQKIGSMSMPQPPQNWPQNERDESHDTKTLPDSNESEEKSKRTRGPTMMHSGWGKDGGNLHIEFNEHGQENTDTTDDMKRILMMSFGSKWKESKHEAKPIGHDPYNTDIERLAHCPNRVEEDQWRSLVHYWRSKEAKEKSERNKESRKKLTMPHTSGRERHSQIIDDMTKMNNGVKPTSIEVFKKTHIRENKQPVNEIAGEVMKQMDDLAEVYPELNVPGSAPNDVYSQVMGSDTHGIVRTLGKRAYPSLVYGPVYKRSQAEKRDFDTRVEMELQKATSAMKIEMTEKMYDAKKEMEAMDKKFLEAKEEVKENNEVMERKLSEAKMDMEEIIADKVKEGIQAYVESLGINIDANIKSEPVPDNPLEDCQQPSSLVPGVHTRKLV
ncbi:hypothetical protein KY290_027523 [Solanum tuberosum]|uniref:Uncharacterized protein n=1 Tax=Solanum tuberosum TaxID=4113 RepID=A0ABQ7UFA7_SOLTU|nr:hypothetical protein KY290_027523 [Solanum tuberosum]